jgi:SWI/SNF-related matrix-associated actin-dependent regulator of chromatin subfamily A containing DEAD/H box 1
MLIFSQWNMILDILEAFLESIDFKYLRLDGSTPIKDRQV